MKAKLIEYLVCPNCKDPLQCEVHKEDTSLPWQEVMEGYLRCETCDREYVIRDGIPRLFNPERIPDIVKDSVNGFGWEWQKFNDQIIDTYMTDKTHFLDFIYPTTPEFFKGRVVLDAGCGMGRFLKLGAEWGSQEIIGVDLSGSVEVAYQNTRDLPNAHVVQADIMTLPFERKFDYIFSVGVIHHLEDPFKGFFKLTGLIKDGGRISVWVYGAENNQWVIKILSPIRTHITSRLPKRLLYSLSQLLGLILFIFLRLVYKPINEHPRGNKLKRYLPYNEYLYYCTRLNYASLVSVIFDHLVPQLAAYVSEKEFENWFKQASLRNILISSRNNMSWRGQGTRIA